MKVGIFLATTSENKEKKKYLDAFGEGIGRVSKDKYFLTKEKKYAECDIAVIFGFYGINAGDVQKVRKQIYTEHTVKRKKNCIFIDADLFKYLGNQKKEENTHVRISYGSIFFDKAVHFNEKSDSSRWDLIREKKEIDYKKYRKHGKHILLCLNSNPFIGRGWSAGNVDIYRWAERAITYIRKYTERDILVRFHPNVKDKDQKKIGIQRYIKAAGEYGIKFSGGIGINHELVIQDTTLLDDCQDAWACVVHNTSASVTPIICGVPVFTNMPNCPVYPIANHSLMKINEPELISREQWLYNTAYCLWNHEEISNGIVWERFRARLNNQGDYSKNAALKLGLV